MKWVCSLAAAALLCAGSACAAELRAGAGKVDITPDAADFPISSLLEGTFTGIHDHIFARAIALDDGKDRVVLVNLEVTDTPGGLDTAQAVANAVGLPASHVLVFASHTHSNPLVFYHGGKPTTAQQHTIDRAHDGAIAAAKQAVAALGPAKIGFARGKAYVNINNGEIAGLASGAYPEGPSDKTLNVLRLETADGKPLALLVNYATHAEVMFHSVSKDNGYEASGDLPGAAMNLLETTGGAPVALWAPGAEGDQHALFESRQPAAGGLPAKDEGSGGWALVDVQARRLVIAVNEALAKMPPASSQASVVASTGAITCPGQKYLPSRATGKLELAPSAPDVSIPLNFIRVGNIALAGVAGDVGSVIGERIREGMPDKQSMVITMTAGAVGYILPDESYALPGHGVRASPIKAGCATPALVNAFRRFDTASRSGGH